VDTERLHGALIAALQPGRSASGSGGRPRWSSGSRAPRDDGDDYLGALVSACRGALAKLPSYPALASAALDAAESAIAYQVHNAGAHTPAGLARMERWAAAQTPAGTDLRWWEAAAAAGSSLGLFAALAAAAEEKLEPGDIEALSSACFSAIGELHSLLDHLIDVEEDAGSGQLNLLSFYSGPRQVAERMRLSAERARALARKSPFAIRYELVLAAMAGFYLSSSEARTSAARPATAAVLEALGPLARAATMVFEARSALKRLRGRGRAFRALRIVWS
jgi:tetraprenyl-beta-curcumene synthase